MSPGELGSASQLQPRPARGCVEALTPDRGPVHGADVRPLPDHPPRTSCRAPRPPRSGGAVAEVGVPDRGLRASGDRAMGARGPYGGCASRLGGHLRARSALPEPAAAGRVPAGRGSAGHLKPGVCRRSSSAGDRWHIRQPVPAARFTAVLPRGASGDTGARRHRQGDGDTAEGSVFGGARRPRGWSPGTGGVRSAAGGAGQGRGLPPPRPVGISGQARSVTAGARPDLPIPGMLIGRPYPNWPQRCRGAVYPARPARGAHGFASLRWVGAAPRSGMLRASCLAGQAGDVPSPGPA
jgi:hypothetical protein